MGRLYNLLTVCFFALVFITCKKDESDLDSPQIKIYSPLSYQMFSVYDSIKVNGIVSDNIKVTSFSVSLRDENNIIVGEKISKQPNLSQYSFSEKLVLSDKYLTSGIYTLKISASDGVNQTNEYVEIHINEMPKERLGLFLFSNVGNMTQLTKLDNNLVATSFANSTGDFIGGGVNSNNQQVVVSGGISGDLQAFDATTAALNWSVQNSSSGLQYFTSLYIHDKNVYSGFYQNNINGFNQVGGQSFLATSLINFFPKLLYIHENQYFASIQQEKLTGENRIVIYYMTGLLKNNAVINGEVKAIYSISANELAFFINQSNVGMLMIYNFNSNSLYQNIVLNPDTIHCVTEVSKGVFLVVQNNEINKVDLNNYTQGLFLSGVNTSLIKYDKISNEVVVVTGTTLNFYDYNTKLLKNSFTHNSVVSTFDFWYNK
ncbi:MAG: hypothetical protein IT232_06020 [Flavobacteriales bacterium]|nr:hypothetical protein [Flavobacteriales bacterium]